MRRLATTAALALLLGALAPLPAAASHPVPVPSSAVAVSRTTPAPLSAAVSPSTAGSRTPAAQPGRTVAAKYQTRDATGLYTTASSSARTAVMPADYTLATRTVRQANGRIHVEYGALSGWVRAVKVAKVPLSTRVGRLTWSQSAAKNIARWCAGVPVTAGRRLDNQATAQLRGHPARWRESITLGTADRRGETMDPNHPAAVATQYHECAHILQYRAYGYNVRALDARMDRVYGRRNGTEHMADCMAVAMGARLSGTAASGAAWRAGYGGKCTAAHLAAARKLIAGQRA